MAAETRVASQSTRKIGANRPGASPAAVTPAVPQPPARRGRTAVVVLLVVGLLAAGAAVFVYLRPAGDAAPPEPQPGEIVPVEALSINLADGRYLRVGFGIELTEGAGEIETAKAADVAIALFSGLSIEEVNDPARRTELKAELTRGLSDAFGGEVMAVYYTDYVTQ